MYIDLRIQNIDAGKISVAKEGYIYLGPQN
jgi:hypothetical protein